MEIKEGFSIYKNGEVYSSKGDERHTHITGEYKVVSDETKEGVRTLILQEKDRTSQKEKARKLSNLLAERLGEGESTTIKELLYDLFKDYYEKELDGLLKKVEKGEPVKASEGCFKIIIGDGRTKRSEHIMLRD